jgi:hypothetical protein
MLKTHSSLCFDVKDGRMVKGATQAASPGLTLDQFQIAAAVWAFLQRLLQRYVNAISDSAGYLIVCMPNGVRRTAAP